MDIEFGPFVHKGKHDKLKLLYTGRLYGRETEKKAFEQISLRR
jgi:hypothetical protein